MTVPLEFPLLLRNLGYTLKANSQDADIPENCVSAQLREQSTHISFPLHSDLHRVLSLEQHYGN